jgi:hypothetical protein
VTDHRKVPQLDLERLAAGEARGAEAAGLKERLRQEPGGMERLTELEASNVETLGRLPPTEVAREIHRRLAEGNWQEKKTTAHAPRWWLVAPALTAVAVAMIWVGPFLSPASDSQVPVVLLGGEEQGRIKGLDPTLLIYRKRKSGDGQQQLSTGAVARAGDLLQVGYVAAGHKYGAIFSLDGSGNWTLHFPAQVNQQPLLATDGEVLLDHSYELDAAPEFERFVYLVHARTFDVRSVQSALKAQSAQIAQGHPPKLPEGFSVTTFELKKEMP